MKKLLASALTALMLLSGTVSVFATDPAPAADGLVLTEGSRLKLDRESR